MNQILDPHLFCIFSSVGAPFAMSSAKRNLSSTLDLAKFGFPAKFIAMVRQFHDGMLARVQNDDEFSDPFPVTNGVKQGCVLASTLFSMMFSAMLTDAFQDGDNGIPIRYRFNGKLCKTKVHVIRKRK